MVSVSHYRKEAARCRQLAAQSPDSEMAGRWRSLAADYDRLADALDTGTPAVPVQRMPMQQQSQPMQQQQSKTEPDEK